MYHVFVKEYDDDRLADTVPVFRGLSHVPPNTSLFSDLRTYLVYAEEKEKITKSYFENQK